MTVSSAVFFVGFKNLCCWLSYFFLFPALSAEIALVMGMWYIPVLFEVPILLNLVLAAASCVLLCCKFMSTS